MCIIDLIKYTCIDETKYNHRSQEFQHEVILIRNIYKKLVNNLQGHLVLQTILTSDVVYIAW